MSHDCILIRYYSNLDYSLIPLICRISKILPVGRRTDCHTSGYERAALSVGRCSSRRPRRRECPTSSNAFSPLLVAPHHSSMSEAYSPPVSFVKRSVKRPTRPTLSTKKSRGGDITPRASPTSLDQTVEDLQTLDMAASFLQHCAFCEKQIMHPSNNMLYCSQA